MKLGNTPSRFPLMPQPAMRSNWQIVGPRYCEVIPQQRSSRAASQMDANGQQRKSATAVAQNVLCLAHVQVRFADKNPHCLSICVFRSLGTGQPPGRVRLFREPSG